MAVGLIEGVEALGTISDGIEAVEPAEAEKPDVVPMNLRMPNMGQLFKLKTMGVGGESLPAYQYRGPARDPALPTAS